MTTGKSNHFSYPREVAKDMRCGDFIFYVSVDEVG